MRVRVVTIFLDYKTHFFSQFWEENEGASYSPNVAYLARYRISAFKDVIKYFTEFFASKFSPYFPPLKPRFVLWSKNMVRLRNRKGKESMTQVCICLGDSDAHRRMSPAS